MRLWQLSYKDAHAEEFYLLAEGIQAFQMSVIDSGLSLVL